MLIADPDLGEKMNADPCGSGSRREKSHVDPGKKNSFSLGIFLNFSSLKIYTLTMDPEQNWAQNSESGSKL